MTERRNAKKMLKKKRNEKRDIGLPYSEYKKQPKKKKPKYQQLSLPLKGKTKHTTTTKNQKWHPAEELNGRLAMIGIVAALSSTTLGQGKSFPVSGNAKG